MQYSGGLKKPFKIWMPYYFTISLDYVWVSYQASSFSLPLMSVLNYDILAQFLVLQKKRKQKRIYFIARNELTAYYRGKNAERFPLFLKLPVERPSSIIHSS